MEKQAYIVKWKRRRRRRAAMVASGEREGGWELRIEVSVCKRCPGEAGGRGCRWIQQRWVLEWSARGGGVRAKCGWWVMIGVSIVKVTGDWVTGWR